MWWMQDERMKIQRVVQKIPKDDWIWGYAGH
jgi:hypothetical protein